MTDLTRYVDPFFGNGTIDLPMPEGVAATWFFLKAQSGNTTPAACAPFGVVSVCAHSGAYPTGYGTNAPNYNSSPPQRFDELVASGFAHFHQSGTGAIDTYYNYLRVTPLVGPLDQLGTRWPLADEVARPGYYAATLGGTEIRAEVTASPKAAFHRYHFCRGQDPRIIADAYYRRLEGIDWRRALDAMVADLRQPRNGDFMAKGVVYPVTHTLDLAGACFCTAQLARGLGRDDLYDEMMDLSSRWRNVYDRETGRLIEAEYYEGGLWNYSFRLLHDMAGRIALYPTEEDFVADLDRFFGYGQPPVVQSSDPRDRDYMRWGYSLNRFEGYNNEPDIETPYAYIYAGRHDRTAEIVRAGTRYMFATGRGGLPGNNDSGGLTSCYLWNAIGLFPVTGQPVFLIGSPVFGAASLRIGSRTFVVETANGSGRNIYVQSALLNGTPIHRAYITVDELLEGGTLALAMGDQPSGWARDERPTSYPSSAILP